MLGEIDFVEYDEIGVADLPEDQISSGWLLGLGGKLFGVDHSDDAIETHRRSERRRHKRARDPAWAGGDALYLRRLARPITPPIARPTLRLVNMVPGPLAGALRTGLDILFTLTPKARPA